MRYCILIMTLLAATTSDAQSRFDKVEILPTKLTDQVYMLQGAGGNIGVILGDEGITLIDDQYAPLSAKIISALRELSDGPIQYVINTHHHGDHTGGNENMAAEGATIIAHRRVRERLAESIKTAEVEISETALPVITFSEEMELSTNGHTLLAIHTSEAHTDGDAIIWIPEANVLHMGDVFFHQRFPYIDVNSGGSVDGLLSAIQRVLLITNEDTQIIPGHGPLATRADVADYETFVKKIKSRVLTKINDGADLEDIDTAEIVEGYADWAWAFIDADTLVKIFYNSLSADL